MKIMYFLFLIIDLKVSLNLIILCVKIVFYYFLLIAPKVSLNLKRILFHSACSYEQCV